MTAVAGAGQVSKVPSHLPRGGWSPQAIRVLEERYLMKDDEGRVVETPDEMVWRVACAIAAAEDRYVSHLPGIDGPAGSGGRVCREWAESFYHEMVSHRFLPNSPTLMNAGTGNNLALSGCYVLPVGDSIPEIFDAVKYQALVHQSGGGTGFGLSRLRPAGSPVRRSQGVASGPVSFLRIFDVATQTIIQGGRRRGANMAVLRVDHPDIREFIQCKLAGGISNFNISVGITDQFMDALLGRAVHPNGVQAPHHYYLVDPLTGKQTDLIGASWVWDEIMRAAWQTGDPGVVFLDRMNGSTANPIPAWKVETTNPCLSGDSLVLTENGLIEARQLDGETLRIWSGSGSYQPATFWKTGVKKIFRVSLTNGLTTDLTEDHRIMTAHGFMSVAQMMEQGEGVLVGQMLGGDWDGGDDTASNAVAFLMGFIQGDGSYHPGGGVYIHLGAGDREVVPEIEAALKELGLKSRWHGDRRVYVESKIQPVLDRFAMHAVPLPERRLAPGIRTSSPRVAREFLRGLYAANGSVVRDRVTLKTTCKEMAQDLQLLLGALGYGSYITTNRPKAVEWKNGTFVGRESYDVNIGSVSAVKFRDEVGFVQQSKREKAERFREDRIGHRASSIASVEYIGERDVYDFSEESAHSGWVQSILTHNCGEQPLYPYDSCNLGSINLDKFVVDTSAELYRVDWAALQSTTRMAVRFLDNVIDVNPYPLDDIGEMTRNVRRIGLGVMGWADMLFRMGISYDSDQAVELGRQVMQAINDVAREESVRLAKERGPFPMFAESIYKDGPPLRNSTRTTIAPTGTISIIAGCSSGIEPVFAMAYQHRVKQPDGTERVLPFTNPVFEQWVKKDSGYHADKDWAAKVLDATARYGSCQQVGTLPDDIKRVFVTAPEVPPRRHVEMQAAFQRYTDNAVSKTVNLPQEATVEDIEGIYRLAWEMGCMGVTVFRSGSKGGEAVLHVGVTGEGKAEGETPVAYGSGGDLLELFLNVGKEDGKVLGVAQESRQYRRRPPVALGRTHQKATPLGTAYITVNDGLDGELLELFLNVGKAGSDTAAVSEALGRLVSLILRLPSTLTPRERAQEMVKQLSGIGGRAAVGFGPQKVLSVPDAVAQVLADEINAGGPPELADLAGPLGEPARGGIQEIQEWKTVDGVLYGATDDGRIYQWDPLKSVWERAAITNPAQVADLCPECGLSTLVREEGCQTCHSCGYSEC